MPEFTGTITEPGLYPDIPEREYHMDPVAHPWGSLSVSAAKLLVPPLPPAKFDYARKHGRLPSKSQKLGTLAHALTFGQPTEDVEVLDFEAWNAAGCKAAKAEAIGAGRTPVLRKEWDEAAAIAAAVWGNKTAAGLLDGADYEVSGFWADTEFGIWQRFRMDAYQAGAFGYPLIGDLKSTADASPEKFAKSMADFGYVRQHVHYRQGLSALLGCDEDDVDFVIIAVESDEPYLTATYRPDEEDIDRARHQLRAARERFRDCSKSGIWPGYSEEIETLELPRYKRQQQERELNEWIG